MLSHLLNPAMLLGLAGLALPVLAHLLSKRNYDVVHWGAMQFLVLSRKTKRHIRLEEILLLLLRMGMIAVLVLALSRPWMSGGLLSRYFSARSRDVVFVIDSSSSMGWEGKAATPHAAAIRWARSFLNDLRPGDTVGLLDARDLVRPIVAPPTRSFDRVRTSLDRFPPPAGSSDLVDAITEAVRMLASTGNLSREVVVLTDGQARPWFPDQEERWELLDDLCAQSAIRPRIWAVDVTEGDGGDRTNFSLETLQTSREFTAVNLPVRFKTKLRYTGGSAPIQRRVYLEIDGQRLADATLQTPLLQPGGEFSLEFEHRFSTAGSHLITAVLDPDDLPGDNRADAAVLVAAALPVLLVDGDPHLDAALSETFFMRAAFSASENETPLVRARSVAADRLTPEDLRDQRVAVLANVSRLTPALADALAEFVAGGGGLLVAPGDKVDPHNYNDLMFRHGAGVLPAALDEIRTDEADAKLGVQIVNAGLKLPLVTPLKRENDGGFTEARFSKWWRLAAPASAASLDGKTERPASSGAKRDPPPPNPTQPPLPADQLPPEGPTVAPPVVAAHLDTGDPFLVLGGFGKGRVVLLAAPLDSDWSTLPAKPDYVPLLHELVFYLAGGAAPTRNVQTGEPLVFTLSSALEPDEKCVFRGPGNAEFAAVHTGDDAHPVLRLDDTRLPGVYTFHRDESRANGRAVGAVEYFVVNFDRGESDLAPLDEKARTALSRNDRLRFIKDQASLASEMFADDSRMELWRMLMLALLGIFALELWFTRRLVVGGYAAGAERSLSEEAEATC